jgi:hypothetical protein
MGWTACVPLRHAVGIAFLVSLVLLSASVAAQQAPSDDSPLIQRAKAAALTPGDLGGGGWSVIGENAALREETGIYLATYVRGPGPEAPSPVVVGVGVFTADQPEDIRLVNLANTGALAFAERAEVAKLASAEGPALARNTAWLASDPSDPSLLYGVFFGEGTSAAYVALAGLPRETAQEQVVSLAQIVAGRLGLTAPAR